MILLIITFFTECVLESRFRRGPCVSHDSFVFLYLVRYQITCLRLDDYRYRKTPRTSESNAVSVGSSDPYAGRMLRSMLRETSSSLMTSSMFSLPPSALGDLANMKDNRASCGLVSFLTESLDMASLDFSLWMG